MGKRAGIAVLAVLGLAGLAFVALFICVQPVKWPYYTPRMSGADVVDNAPLFLPRQGMAPYAKFQLAEGAYVRIHTNCYPLERSGVQPCGVVLRFFNPYDAEIAFADDPVSITGPEGEELINLAFYRENQEKFAKYPGFGPKFEGDRVTLRYARINTLSLKPIPMPATFTLNLPALVINGTTVAVPPVGFHRTDNLTCLGMFTNF